MSSIEPCAHAMDGASRTPQPIMQTSTFALVLCKHRRRQLMATAVSTDTTTKRDATTECKTHCGVEIKAIISRRRPHTTYQVEAADALSTHRLSSWHLYTGQASSMTLSAGSRSTMDGIFERLLSEMRTAHTSLTHRLKWSGSSVVPLYFVRFFSQMVLGAALKS